MTKYQEFTKKQLDILSDEGLRGAKAGKKLRKKWNDGLANPFADLKKCIEKINKDKKENENG